MIMTFTDHILAIYIHRYCEPAIFLQNSGLIQARHKYHDRKIIRDLPTTYYILQI